MEQIQLHNLHPRAKEQLPALMQVLRRHDKARSFTLAELSYDIGRERELGRDHHIIHEYYINTDALTLAVAADAAALADRLAATPLPAPPEGSAGMPLTQAGPGGLPQATPCAEALLRVLLPQPSAAAAGAAEPAAGAAAALPAGHDGIYRGALLLALLRSLCSDAEQDRVPAARDAKILACDLLMQLREAAEGLYRGLVIRSGALNGMFFDNTRQLTESMTRAGLLVHEGEGHYRLSDLGRRWLRTPGCEQEAGGQLGGDNAPVCLSIAGGGPTHPALPAAAQLLADAIAQQLAECRNLVLHGPPGTGKTFMAREAARILTRDATGGERPQRIGFVQFHPSYDYSDFIEGLRPCLPAAGGQQTPGFGYAEGTFKRFCRAAAQQAGAGGSFVFIIDEINRGDLGRIFGELLYCLEPSCRATVAAGPAGGPAGGPWPRTMLQNLIPADDCFAQGFYVPDNVCIIATMNDLDRSLETMDFAMRRRFAFREITAGDSLESILTAALGDLPGCGAEQLGSFMRRCQALNERLGSLPGLGPHYQLGGACFAPVRRMLGGQGRGACDLRSGEVLGQLWELHLAGTLHEYLRGIMRSPELEQQLQELRGLFLQESAAPPAAG